MLGVPFTYYTRRRFVDKMYELFQCGLDLEKTGLSSSSAWADTALYASLAYAPQQTYIFVLAFAVSVFCYLFDQSSLRNIPMVSDYIRIPSARQGKKVKPDWLDLADSRSQSFHLFKLVIRDVYGFFPKVGTIEDVLRLREDKRIARFRRKISEFSQGLRKGDTKNLEEMKAAVVQANRALKKLEPFRRIAKWTTYLSLPLSVAEAIFYLPILGPSLATIGVASQIKAEYSKLKHDWILFGRPQ